MTLQVPKIICLSCGANMSFVSERKFASPDMYEYVCPCGKSEVVDISTPAMIRATDNRLKN